MTCECCRETRLTVRPRAGMFVGRQVSFVLCDRCAQGSHTPGLCRRCALDGVDEVVWYCARIAHVANKHPGLLEIRHNRPDDPPMPQPKKIGTLYLP